MDKKIHIPDFDYEGKCLTYKKYAIQCECGAWYDGRYHNICPQCGSGEMRFCHKRKL